MATKAVINSEVRKPGGYHVTTGQIAEGLECLRGGLHSVGKRVFVNDEIGQLRVPLGDVGDPQYVSPYRYIGTLV